MTNQVEYSSNNSGGGWWLTDDDWSNLEKAGWSIRWEKDLDRNKMYGGINGDRFLGALAIRATRDSLSLTDAIAEWEQVTGQSADAEGCECCGQPHEFYEHEVSDDA